MSQNGHQGITGKKRKAECMTSAESGEVVAKADENVISSAESGDVVAKADKNGISYCRKVLNSFEEEAVCILHGVTAADYTCYRARPPLRWRAPIIKKSARLLIAGEITLASIWPEPSTEQIKEGLLPNCVLLYSELSFRNRRDYSLDAMKCVLDMLLRNGFDKELNTVRSYFDRVWGPLCPLAAACLAYDNIQLVLAILDLPSEYAVDVNAGVEENSTALRCAFSDIGEKSVYLIKRLCERMNDHSLNRGDIICTAMAKCSPDLNSPLCIPMLECLLSFAASDGTGIDLENSPITREDKNGYIFGAEAVDLHARALERVKTYRKEAFPTITAAFVKTNMHVAEVTKIIVSYLLLRP